MLWIIAASSELLISFKLDCWVPTCKQSKNETSIHILELPNLQLAMLKYRYENNLNSSVILIWRLDCCYCQDAFEKIIKYACIYRQGFFFCFLHIPVLLTSFSIFFWVFCKYFIVDLQSRMLDLSKITVKPGTQNAKLFVGLCATYLVCTTILSKLLIQNYTAQFVNGTSGSSLFLFTIRSPETAFHFIITYTPIF